MRSLYNLFYNFYLVSPSQELTESTTMIPDNTTPVLSPTIFKVKVLVPSEYALRYELGQKILASDLRKIADEVENQINSSVRFQKNKFNVKLQLEFPEKSSTLDLVDEKTCEGAIITIADLLNKVNNEDPTHHNILLLPCFPQRYADVFNSVSVQVPIIDHSINVQCTKRLVVFQEVQYDHLLASFGNALLRVLGQPQSKYTKITQTHLGDFGIRNNLELADDVVHSMLSDPCFYNILTSNTSSK